MDGEIAVKVDAGACIGCGSCVADCFPGVMRMAEGGVAECVAPCLECGHCVAVCPADAVSIEGYDMADVQPCGAVPFDAKTLLHAVKSRRSIRCFERRQLDGALLNAMLEAGRYTPTARNLQGTAFIVIQREMPQLRELLWRELPGVVRALEAQLPAYARMFDSFVHQHEATGRDPLLFDAPTFIAVATENAWDAGLAAANMELAAAAGGAGVLHSGYLKRIVGASPALQEWLGLEGRPAACCMLAGYPAVTYRRTAPRKPGNFTVR